MINLPAETVAAFFLSFAVVFLPNVVVGQEKPALMRIGHRGAPTLAPENTLASVRAAFEAGVDGIEFDVKRFTADHKMVVIHDPDLSRTTNGGKANVSDKTLAELRVLDAGSWGPWANGPFAGQRLPLPEEMLRDILAGGAFPVIHIDTVDQAPEIMRVVTEANAQDKAVIFCFDYAVMERLAKEYPGVRKGWLLGDDAFKDDPIGSIVAKAVKAQCAVLAPSAGIVTPELTAGCHDAGLLLWTWTVDEEPAMERMIGLGVDGIITDAPQLLNAVLARRSGSAK